MARRSNRPAEAIISASSTAELNSAAILTKQQAANLLQCTPRFLERQIAAGRLRACKVMNKFVRILWKDLEAFLAQGATMEARR
jgi:excisionase family DNA binding protein